MKQVLMWSESVASWGCLHPFTQSWMWHTYLVLAFSRYPGSLNSGLVGHWECSVGTGEARNDGGGHIHRENLIYSHTWPRSHCLHLQNSSPRIEQLEFHDKDSKALTEAQGPSQCGAPWEAGPGWGFYPSQPTCGAFMPSQVGKLSESLGQRCKCWPPSFSV